MAVTKNIYMKKKQKIYVCGICDNDFTSPQGISAHVRNKHADTFEVGEIDNKGRLLTGWQKVEGAPAYVKEPDTKGKITAAESTPMIASMLDIPPAAASEPWHYSILKDFEEAVREHEMRGSSEFPEICEEEYKRAKRLLALRFLLLKHRSEVADLLERELMQ
jgi:hypothetical protein